MSGFPRVLRAATYLVPSSEALYLGRLKDGMSCEVILSDLTLEV